VEKSGGVYVEIATAACVVLAFGLGERARPTSAGCAEGGSAEERQSPQFVLSVPNEVLLK
jgi:hypothetical protein